MKKVICDLYKGYDSRVREIRLVFNTDKFKDSFWGYTTLTMAVMYVRPQKSLNGGKLGVYTFNSASEFVQFLKGLSLSESYIDDIWKGFKENDRIGDELEEFLTDLTDEEYDYHKEVEYLKAMYEAF